MNKVHAVLEGQISKYNDVVKVKLQQEVVVNIWITLNS